MPSRPQDIEPLSKQLTIMICLMVVGFMAFGLALSFYRNILFERTLSELEGANRQIAANIDRGYQNLEYYRSDQYRDKYAKENLGKLNPGEKVLIITDPPQDLAETPENAEQIAERREAAYQEILRQMPIQEHWKLYLFYPEKIEELKKGL